MNLSLVSPVHLAGGRWYAGEPWLSTQMFLSCAWALLPVCEVGREPLPRPLWGPSLTRSPTYCGLTWRQSPTLNELRF